MASRSARRAEKLVGTFARIQHGQSTDATVAVAAWCAAGVCWEPYAVLRYLKKPVDLIMLRAGTHVKTNPTQRLASETINVDWFRFWLKGEEDPDPAKAEQYARWRELRKLQEENEKKAVPSGR